MVFVLIEVYTKFILHSTFLNKNGCNIILNKKNNFIFLIALCCTLSTIGIVVAEDRIMITSDEAINLVNNLYIPQTLEEFNDMDNEVSLDWIRKWSSSYANESILLWRFEENWGMMEPYCWITYIIKKVQ